MTPSSPASADVVIVGGGVMGSATAYYLATMGRFPPGRIVLVERDMTFAACSTARSAGGIRQQFSTPENIAMSQATLALLRTLKQTFGADADVGFREQGYLILASDSGAEILRGNAAVQRAAGADIILLDPDALATRFPWLVRDGVVLGSFGQSGEGWMDPVSLMTLFRNAARASGATIVNDTVIGVGRLPGRISGVVLAGGGRIACGALVNAAGPAAGAVAAMAGIALPVEPRKRYVYVLDCRDATDAMRKGPLTVDPSGVWFRPEGRFFIAGLSPEEPDEPTPGDLDAIDHDFFETAVWPGLAARAPVFEAIKVTSAWAGHYDYNTLDQNAVIGPHPELVNLYFANGFSGHGLQQSAAAGRAIAELIVHGGYRSIDLTRFGYGRIVRGEPLVELNVI
jgi:FAD-dependent oxidoreductase domain-containing protein 1